MFMNREESLTQNVSKIFLNGAYWLGGVKVGAGTSVHLDSLGPSQSVHHHSGSLRFSVLSHLVWLWSRLNASCTTVALHLGKLFSLLQP